MLHKRFNTNGEYYSLIPYKRTSFGKQKNVVLAVRRSQHFATRYSVTEIAVEENNRKKFK
jgi:hypothetical protein